MNLTTQLDHTSAPGRLLSLTGTGKNERVSGPRQSLYPLPWPLDFINHHADISHT